MEELKEWRKQLQGQIVWFSLLWWHIETFVLGVEQYYKWMNEWINEWMKLSYTSSTDHTNERIFRGLWTLTALMTVRARCGFRMLWSECIEKEIDTNRWQRLFSTRKSCGKLMNNEESWMGCRKTIKHLLVSPTLLHCSIYSTKRYWVWMLVFSKKSRVEDEVTSWSMLSTLGRLR